MNTKWFRQQLDARKISQRGLARLMGLDAAAVSLMLRGQRRMTSDEAHQISNIFGMPITEVLRQAGVEVSDDVRYVPVVGYVDISKAVTLFPDGTHDRVVGPADCPNGTYALQKRAPAHPHDGWMILVSPSKNDPDEHLGQMCCVATDKGEHLIAFISRGYRSSTHNLINGATGSLLRTDVNLAWASSILWIKPC